MKTKMTTLATIIVCAVVTPPLAQSATIYDKDGTRVQIGGQFRPMLLIKDGERTDLRDRGSRLELIISQDIGYGFKAIGKTRITFYGRDSNGSNYSGFGNPTTGQLYAGFEHNQIGRLYFGNLPTNGDAIMLGDWQLNCCGSNPLTAEAKKAVHFRSSPFYNFRVGADYIFGETQKDNNITKNLKNGYGLALYYDQRIDNTWLIRFRAGYTQDNYDSHNFTALNTTTNSNQIWTAYDVKREAFRVAGEIGYKAFSFAYNYGEIKHLNRLYYLDTKAVKEKRHFFALKYNLTEQVALYSQYRREEKIFKNNGYTVGVDYRPIRNLITFVEFARDRNINGLYSQNKYVNQYSTGFRLLF